MTKALQATADALDTAGSAFRNQGRDGLLRAHELAQELRDPAARYSARAAMSVSSIPLLSR
jgi:hypothetical protein